MTQQMNRPTWIRSQIINNPTITYKELLEAYDKSGLPPEERPKDPQYLYQARNTILTKYGLAAATDIPRKKNNDLNLTAMIRLVQKACPTFDNQAIKKYLAQDGIVVTDALLSNVRCVDRKKAESPDENQHSGPRAGKPKRRIKRRVKRQTKQVVENGSEELDAKFYERIERELEQLIDKAEKCGKSLLINKLRDARRAASAAILEHAEKLLVY